MVRIMSELKKPFWLYPPYIVLFDLLRLHRIKPWDVNIVYLLSSFLEKMKKQGLIDFYASGIALLSSSVIHRIKSELVLKMEEPPKLPEPRPDEVVPPPIPVPIRFEYTSTTIKDVLVALDEVLSKSMASNEKYSEQILEPPPIVEQLDEYLINVDKHISGFFNILKKQSQTKKSISFNEITKGLSYLDKIRRFICILFLAAEEKIDAIQDMEFGDIIISIKNG